MQKLIPKKKVSEEEKKMEKYLVMADEIFKKNGLTPTKDELRHVADRLKNIDQITMGAHLAAKRIGAIDLDFTLGESGRKTLMQDSTKKKILDRADIFCSDEVVDALMKYEKVLADGWISTRMFEDWFNMPSLVPYVAKVLVRQEAYDLIHITDGMNVKRSDIIESISKIAQNYSESSSEILEFIGRFKGDKEKNKELLFLFNSDNAKKEEITRFIGEYEKITKALKEQYNIEYYGRYSIPCLLELYDKIGKKLDGRPKALVAYPYSDWNNAFYQDKDIMESLRKRYDVRIIESGNEEDFISFSKKMRSHGKFDFLVIAGHGEPTSIRLGDDKAMEEKAMLDLSDKDVVEKLNKMLNHSNKRISVALFSCSTGDPKTTSNIASMISASLEVPKVFAPDKVTGVFALKFDVNNCVSDVEYSSAASKKYSKGKPVNEEKKK